MQCHISSASHKKCVEIETGEPACKKQKKLSESFGNAKHLAKNGLTPLLHASVYIGRKERPYSELPDLLDICQDLGLKTTCAFNNDKACKVFNHITSQQMVRNLCERVQKCNFNSWMIDGSTAAKRKLSYETELVYIRTAHEVNVQTELLSCISMQPYSSANADNIFHALLKELVVMRDRSMKNDEIYLKPVHEVSTDQLLELIHVDNFHKKIIGATAD